VRRPGRRLDLGGRRGLVGRLLDLCLDRLPPAWARSSAPPARSSPGGGAGACAAPWPDRRLLHVVVEAGARAAVDRLRQLELGLTGQRRVHVGLPDAARQPAAGDLDAVHRDGARVGVAEPHGGRQLRGEADEPRVLVVGARAGLAGSLPPAVELGGATGAALHDLLHGPGGVRRDVLAEGRRTCLRLGLEEHLVAAPDLADEEGPVRHAGVGEGRVGDGWSRTCTSYLPSAMPPSTVPSSLASGVCSGMPAACAVLATSAGPTSRPSW
jgi:hypothetical protein